MELININIYWKNDTIMIFTDGSTKPDPGIGVAGIVIQYPSFPKIDRNSQSIWNI